MADRKDRAGEFWVAVAAGLTVLIVAGAYGRFTSPSSDAPPPSVQNNMISTTDADPQPLANVTVATPVENIAPPPPTREQQAALLVSGHWRGRGEECRHARELRVVNGGIEIRMDGRPIAPRLRIVEVDGNIVIARNANGDVRMSVMGNEMIYQNDLMEKCR